jgi:hypothetical protein
MWFLVVETLVLETLTSPMASFILGSTKMSIQKNFTEAQFTKLYQVSQVNLIFGRYSIKLIEKSQVNLIF